MVLGGGSATALQRESFVVCCPTDTQRILPPILTYLICTAPSQSAAGRGVMMEAIERNLSALDDDARTAAVQRDAPELAALLQELRGALAEVRGRVGPLLQEVSGRVRVVSGLIASKGGK